MRSANRAWAISAFRLALPNGPPVTYLHSPFCFGAFPMMPRTLSLGFLLLFPFVALAQKPGITEENFGTAPEIKDPKDPTKIIRPKADISAYTLTNKNGAKVKILTLGGIVSELVVPDKDGKMADVVLGHDSLKGYLDGHPYFGCITGRVAANTPFTAAISASTK
jgi:hypothetical protein